MGNALVTVSNFLDFKIKNLAVQHHFWFILSQLAGLNLEADCQNLRIKLSLVYNINAKQDRKKPDSLD